jgi:hypothetical protein
MFKGLFQLLVVVLIGILIYNYFLGSPEEKASSREIFSKAGELGKAAFQLLRAEKEKFDQGKYQEAVGRVGDILDTLQAQAKETRNPGAVRSLDELERSRLELEQKVAELEKIRQSGNRVATKAQEAEVKEDWQRLLNATEMIMKQLDAEGPPR